ncbi:hypothetical protein [Lichenihabitans psoromatis]|uniref:hypothetical protein n=2 Tax=Lichenihabitans TaxID=2723776 RepID=UPI001036A440|nr:hypothetical protein [Lichenihabitans psoromatis]
MTPSLADKTTLATSACLQHEYKMATVGQDDSPEPQDNVKRETTMAFARRGGGGGLSAPKIVTFVISLLLVLLAVVSLYTHLPASLGFVNQHRFWLVVAGYAVLTLGVLLPGV